MKTDNASVFIPGGTRPSDGCEYEQKTRYDMPMKVKLPRLVRGLNIRREQRLPDLGERELSVLEVLWEREEVTAQSVKEAMPDAVVSLSTVQSTLERLHRKNLIERFKEGRAYRYRATVDKSDLIANLIRDMAQHVARGDVAPMISGFLSYVSEQAPERLSDLPSSLEIDPGSASRSNNDDD